ncbi:MAG TPA: hypothetical protein VFE46_07990, partial [Pirellulales bacterium]|nr:hypothetical protein [Pirellulales bacterium]
MIVNRVQEGSEAAGAARLGANSANSLPVPGSSALTSYHKSRTGTMLALLAGHLSARRPPTYKGFIMAFRSIWKGTL